MHRTKPESSKQKEECMKFVSVAGILNPFNEFDATTRKLNRQFMDI